MPVLPLVGSISSLPGLRMPRCSASQIMDAPILHFTENAGLRASTLASIVTGAPSMTRFSFTSGVLPMLSELSEKVMLDQRSDIPVGDETRLSFFPSPREFGECGRIDQRADGAVYAFPKIRERIGSAPGFLTLLNVPQHLSDGDLVGRASQAVATFGAAAGFHKSTLLEARKNQLQEFLRDFLTPGDLRDFNWLTLWLNRQIEDGVQGVLGFDRDIHRV